MASRHEVHEGVSERSLRNSRTMRKKIVAVIGASEAEEMVLRDAEAVGAGIAERDALLISGGLGGVMEAACRGAKQAGGTTIGILPGTERSDASSYVDIRIVTGLSQARNVIIARSCDAAVAISGKYGTLSEIAYCLMFGVPVIGLGTWRLASDSVTEPVPITYAANVNEVLNNLDRILRG